MMGWRRLRALLSLLSLLPVLSTLVLFAPLLLLVLVSPPLRELSARTQPSGRNE